MDLEEIAQEKLSNTTNEVIILAKCEFPPEKDYNEPGLSVYPSKVDKKLALFVIGKDFPWSYSAWLYGVTPNSIEKTYRN